MGAQSAVVKGGHLEGPPTDVFFDGIEFAEFTTQRIQTASTHGTGCTFASARGRLHRARAAGTRWR